LLSLPSFSQADREARISEELEQAGPSSRVVEESALLAKLTVRSAVPSQVVVAHARSSPQPLGYALRDIKADGHCLYRSLEDQLALEQGAQRLWQSCFVRRSSPPVLSDCSAAPPGCDVPALRASTAAFMRAHEADYRPFLDLPEQEDAYDAYCCEIEATAAWGGQLELRALAHVLRRRILVFSAHMETVEMGCEYGGEAPLRVAYQQHAYGLGEHFNSVVPAVKDEVTL